MTNEEIEKLDFKIALQNTIQAAMQDELVRIEHRFFRQANTSGEGLVLILKDDKVAPVIHVDDMYEIYKSGVSVDDIVNNFMNSYKNMRKDIPELSRENLEKSLYTVVINKHMNESLLKTVPYRIVANNLAEVARFRVSSNEKGQTSFQITNQHCRYLHMLPDEILDIAHKNTENQQYILENLSKITAAMFNDEELKDIYDEDYAVDDIMLLSNTTGIDGANVITSQKIMKEVSEQLDCNYYALPSSRHELIIVPENFDVDERYLIQMVREVNKTLDKKDFLSDDIYYYNAQKMTLSQIGDKQLQEKAITALLDRKPTMKH